MKIITDSSSLLSPAEGEALGVTVTPACAVIDGEVYRDYIDIDSEEFLKRIEAGAVPTSSQPAIGDVLDVFEGYDEEMLYLSIGDGLSGALHYLVCKAAKLRNEGVGIETIKSELQKSIDVSVSFVIPADFDFLKRSGRLTPIAAKIGGMIKLVPVLTQTADMKRITPFVIKRSNKKAMEAIIGHLQSMGVDENFVISVCHGGAERVAESVCEQLKERFPDTEVELFALSPALITHGGPGSIVVQAIRK